MNKATIHNMVTRALAEDLVKGDITTNHLIPSAMQASAVLIAKANGICCGLPIAHAAFKCLDSKIRFKAYVKEGSAVKAGQRLAQITGKARAILSAERVALNFLTWASGIATTTHAFVAAIKPYKSAILDTRKTTPLFRELERYAVRCGGGVNHRFNLNDMALIKDNHRTALREKPLRQVVNDLKIKIRKKVEVEVDDLAELQEVLQSNADIILLDNMPPSMVKQAVLLKRKLKSNAQLEASGGIHLNNVKAYASTGIDRISIGSLTHSRVSLDVSLDFIA